MNYVIYSSKYSDEINDSIILEINDSIFYLVGITAIFHLLFLKAKRYHQTSIRVLQTLASHIITSIN